MRLKLWFYAITSGLLTALAWSSFGFGLVLLFSMFPLLLIEDYIDKNKHRLAAIQSFYYSYITFLVWNITSTWWIYNSTGFGAIMAFILNSAFYSVIFLIFHLIKRKFGYKIGYFRL